MSAVFTSRQRRIAARLALLALLALSSGCAMQFNGGAAWDMDAKRFVGGGSFDMKLVQMRGHGPLLGVHVPVVIDSVDAPIVVRGAVLQLGGRVRLADRFALESALDFGLGSPLARRYDSAGAYAGIELAGVLRLWGAADYRPSFSTGYAMTDLVLTVRSGAWSPPAGEDGDWIDGEFTMELGLRITLGSDILSRQRWQEGSGL